jgi:glycosyltransferase involved in cell wall biosynthesis
MKENLKICLVMQGNRNWIGGIEYTKNMILALTTLPQQVQSTIELSLLSNRSIDIHLYEQILPHVKNIFFMEKLPTPSIPSRIHRIIDRALSGNNDYRYHSFFENQRFDFVYPFQFHRKLSASYRSAAWIPDFQHKHLPHFFSNEEIRKRDHQFQQIAHYAPAIILSSKTAEIDFHTSFPQFSEKTMVLPFRIYPDPSWYSPDPQDFQRQYSLPDKFFIMCNQFWQHKNHITVFKALHLLRKQSIEPVVVCTGNLEDHRDKTYMAHLQKTIDDSGIRSQIHILGLIPRLEQIQLIRRSIAVIQPSLFEGWSTVIEDARCLGKHVLASDISVHKEQDPPHCIFFQPESAEELAVHIKEWWMTLSTGPAPENENSARQSAMDSVRAYGYNILDLARGTT